MILVDTSVWVEHFARRNEAFATLLEENAVLIHPFVIGELALGHLRTREATLKTLRRLPQSGVATAHEILHLVEQHRLFGLGIGYVDVHLLAAALMGGTPLWTHDRRLSAAAAKLGVAYGLFR